MYKRRHTSQNGFSIPELLVSCMIFAVVGLIIVSGYNTNSAPRLALDNAADDLLGRIREAQAYAMAIRRHASGVYPSWGIYISKSTPSQTLLYADIDEDGRYTTGGTCGTAASECVSILPLAKGIKIISLCGAFTDTSKAVVPGTCTTDSTSDYFDIFFQRPFSDINITGDPGDGSGLANYRTSAITLQSTRLFKKTVAVNFASEMTVYQP